MMRRRPICLAFALLGFWLWLPHASRAQIPGEMSLQGVITDSTGVGLIGTVELTFRLFLAESGGAVIWSEVHPAVMLDDGIYSVALGSITPFAGAAVDFSAPYWLETDVDTGGGAETLSPRVPLRSVAYAFRSGVADSAALAQRADTASHALVADTVLSSIQVDTTAFAFEAGTAQFAFDADSAQHALVADTVLASIQVDTTAFAFEAGTAQFAFDADSAQHAVIADTALFALAAQGEIELPFSGFDSSPATAFSVTQTGTGALFAGTGANGGGEDFRVDNDGSIHLMDASDNEEVVLDPDGSGSAGEIRLYADGSPAISMLASQTAGEGAVIELRNATGAATIILDAQFGGDGRVITEELEITGGADLSERFSLTPSNDVAPEPGTVLSIDPSDPGKLTVSTKAYDPMVAGVVSGAGGVETGLIMSQKGSETDGEVPVALVGRVYVKADADYGDIQPGDLLTTSDAPGHAMRVSDYDRARGAILGKAMTGLEEGTGLVLVLITLQ